MGPANPASALPGTEGALLPTSSSLFVEPFDQLDPQVWRQVEVKGETLYTIVDIDGQHSLKADSRDQASIMLRPTKFDPKIYPILSWRWRVDKLVDKEDLRTKDGSDAAARVYVYFDTGSLPWKKRSIDYVWSKSLPVGTVLSSAFSKFSKIIVVESGAEHLGQWRTESRNIVEDYRRCYDQKVPRVVAIGLMTDADNTHSEAVAYYDDVTVSRDKPRADAGR